MSGALEAHRGEHAGCADAPRKGAGRDGFRMWPHHRRGRQRQRAVGQANRKEFDAAGHDALARLMC